LYENLSYEDYSRLLYRCKYGIHFKPEPFGISVAEMVKAGIIPFARDEGGPLEIIGRENRALFFKTFEDAVERVTDVLRDPGEQARLLGTLESRRSLFSTERFRADIARVVAGYFQEDR
jgi:glycosyltransferase involved in cell wall biosynthesis